MKVYKIKAKTEFEKLLTVLRSKTYLVYIPIRNIVIKTPFIKLYEPKNPLILKKVLKSIKVRPLNNIVVIEDFTEERISLDLLEIDNISFLKPIIFEISRSSKPLELPTPRPFKPPKLKNKFSKPMLRPSEEPIKPIDSSDPDEIQLNLIINLCYRIKAKIFKKKLDKNSSTPNIYK